MNRLAFVLFLAVLGTHYAYPMLASIYGGGLGAERAWFYVLRGIEGVALFLAVAALAHRSTATVAVCLWGTIEEAQTAACRLAIGIANKQPNEAGQSLCDMLTGWPIYALTLGVVLLVLYWNGNRTITKAEET